MDDEDKELFLEEYNLNEPGLNRLIIKGYELLGLETFFTAGKKEVKAWTIRKGFSAPKAAGVIHTDFERGFIKAEIYTYDDLMEFKSEVKINTADISILGRKLHAAFERKRGKIEKVNPKKNRQIISSSERSNIPLWNTINSPSPNIKYDINRLNEKK